MSLLLLTQYQKHVAKLSVEQQARGKLTGILVGEQLIAHATASRYVEGVQQCRAIKETVVQHT
jgi:hypothetical protein